MHLDQIGLPTQGTAAQDLLSNQRNCKLKVLFTSFIVVKRPATGVKAVDQRQI